MRPCMGCEFRRVGCHADCESGKAQERENAAKREHLRNHNYSSAEDFLYRSAEKRRRK